MHSRHRLPLLLLLCICAAAEETATGDAAAGTATRQPTPPSFQGFSFEDIIAPQEPVYFLMGWEPRRISKFQLSLRVRLLAIDDPQHGDWRDIDGFFLAYTQTSFWDWDLPSAPFLDTSYKPEAFYQHAWDHDRAWAPDRIAVGVAHESNGRDGDASRSINLLVVQPDWDHSVGERWLFRVSPRLWSYIEKSENPDIQDYRGYGELRLRAEHAAGLVTTATLRPARKGGYAELNASYPIAGLGVQGIDLRVHGQLTTGHGESILGYKHSHTVWRIGFSLVH